MSFISDFEQHISSVFGSAPQGYAEPFSFKKLAKRAAKEMEHETYVIDGIDTAPALYTVLVSPNDDSLMRPLYADLTAEIAAFVAAQAQRKGYVFVGTPLVRFMVDPSLKSGKFAIFAENIDGVTLDHLRDEERAFLGGNSSVGGAAAVLPHKNHTVNGPSRQAGRPAMQVATPPDPEPEPLPVRDAEELHQTPPGFTGTDAGLAVMPVEFVEAEGAIPVVSAAESTPLPVVTAASGAQQDIPPVAAVPTASPVPTTQRRQTPSNARRSVGRNTAEPASEQEIPSCFLIDRQSGRSYRVEAPVAIIGRERSQADVVLRDPNVSRRHAELHYDGRHWHVADLRSTNGTLVNDIDVDEIILHDGDLITVGLVNLEFREN